MAWRGAKNRMSQKGQYLMAKFSKTRDQQRLDGEWQGDDVSYQKTTSHTRIVFHNVNGLSVRGVEGFDLFANEQDRLQIDIQCFSEHCLDTTKFFVTQTAKDALRPHFPGQYTIQLDSSEETATNVYKPGGTGILVLGNAVSRQEPNGRGGDSMGRWSYLHFRRRNLPPITLISAYQVCPRPTNILGNTAYHQQVRALNSDGMCSLHPRQAFMRDMDSFIESLLVNGHEVILGGDFNESLEDKNSGLLKLVTKHHLTDPFLSRFPHHQSFGTHIFGNRRIDSVFLTPGLLPSLCKIGYAPFDYATPSDHRPLFLEFNTRTLFGQYHNPIPPATTRVIRTKDKKAVTTFIHRWYQEVLTREGFNLKQQLDTDTAEPNLVERVDEILGTGGNIAEQACKRRRSEFFSQQIVQHRLRVSILRGHLNALKTGADRSPQLTRRMHRGGLNFPLPETQRTTKLALQQANQCLQETKRQHTEIRQAELEAKIEEAIQHGNKTRANALRSIKNVENNYKTYKILQAMKQRTRDSQGIDRIEIPASWPTPDQSIESVAQLEDPKSCSEWRLITDPVEVEYFLMLRNRLHFGQAEGTPFTRTPLREDFDWAAMSQESDQLLHGSYQYTSNIPNCDDLLRACKMATTLDALPAEITLNEFKEKIRKWRESTATSPSGRHLGRYKALFTTGLPEENTNEEHSSLLDKQESLTALILSVINYCIRNNYVLRRWKSIVNVMIFKEVGNYKIHRLRVIHIYEADFNMILAVKWRQLLHSADGKKLINEGQYGGRPGCEAQSLTLLEELKYDLAYLTRRTLFNFDNDAASCYDRIVVPLASIINRKYGLHHKVVAVHANTLQQAQFRLKTAAGISDHHYSPCNRFPIHGTGQGSGNSPCIWLFISSTLFDTHKSLAHGAKFISPDGNHFVTFSMVGFVDDSTGTCNDFSPQQEATIQELLQRMQHDAQLWSNLLYCSGGKLELQKCSFHVLRFQFRPNGQPVPSLDTYDNLIRIHDLETDEQIPIPSKRAFDPHKTLGHFKSPYSKQAKELSNLKSKADRLALLISNSPITRQGAMLAYNTVYIPSIQYTLPQSFFSKKDLDQAQSSSIHRILAKCGYNRNTARAIVFAPKKYAGGGFLPWYLLQGEGQVKHFIKHWRSDSLVSRTLRVAVSWAQWQSGHGSPILEDTTTPISYLECRWLHSLREFLCHIHASISVDIPIVARPESQYDVYIMDYAMQCGLFSLQDLKILNYCRLYLHVTTVSELFDANGASIIPELFQCRREPWFNPSTYVTLQKRPSNYQIRMKWQKLCRQWSDASGKIAESLKLGNWTTDGSQLRRRRQTYYLSGNHKLLYHFRDGCYWKFTRQGNKSRQYQPLQPSAWQPTQDCVPLAVIENEDGTLRIPPQARRRYRSPMPPHIATSFTQYINSLSTRDQQLICGVQLYAQPYEVLQKISKLPENSSVLLVSDGSQKGTRITYGWVFGSDKNEIYAEHSGEGYGEATSHRAEGFAMLSGLLFLHHLCRYINVNGTDWPFSVPLLCFSDNQGLVTRITQRRHYQEPYPNATLAPDWDLLEQIHQMLTSLPASDVEVAWVKGHQDDDNADLSTAAIFNIRADKLAGQVATSQHPASIHEHPPLLPAEKCRLTINGVIIQSHYTRSIRHSYTMPPYQAYLQERHGWTNTQVTHIDWEAFSRAADHVPSSIIQVSKLVHDKLPTNYELSKSNPNHSPKCRYCHDKETFFHLLTCPHETPKCFRQIFLDFIHQYLTRQEIHEEFQISFMHCLHYSLDQDYQICCNVESSFRDCILAQVNLGRQSIFHGHFTCHWRQMLVDTAGTHSHDSGQDPIDVIAGIIKQLWLAQLDFWKRHLNEIHTSTSVLLNPNNDKLLQYKSRIRLLHSKRELCLHGHRDAYFHSDVESYLNSATGTQMRQYLHHYEPAIHASIKVASNQPRHTLLSFSGFSRVTQDSSRPRPYPTAIPTTTNPTGRRGTPLNRKHTRWRNPGHAIQSIRNFFQPKPG